jgi:Zn-dependent protease
VPSCYNSSIQISGPLIEESHVLLAEPPPSQGDVHFSLLGFPVRIHWLFWVVTGVLGLRGSDNGTDPIVLVSWVVAVLLCILLHELGHAVVMRHFGYDASIVLYSFGGLAIPRGRRSYGREPGAWAQILIAFGGPASGFILAALMALGLRFLGGYQIHFMEGGWRDIVPRVFLPNQVLDEFVYQVFFISVWWGLMNLLPVYPLDGGQIAYHLFSLFHPQDAMRQALILSIMVGGIMCAVALVQWKDMYVGILFGMLAYSSFATLQQSRIW